jgi:hypothetical protein
MLHYKKLFVATSYFFSRSGSKSNPLLQKERGDESMGSQNIHDRVVQNSYKSTNNFDMQFSSFGERQNDMNDGVVYDITTNSTKIIFVGANLPKSITEKTFFFKYGKASVWI